MSRLRRQSSPTPPTDAASTSRRRAAAPRVRRPRARRRRRHHLHTVGQTPSSRLGNVTMQRQRRDPPERRHLRVEQHARSPATRRSSSTPARWSSGSPARTQARRRAPADADHHQRPRPDERQLKVPQESAVRLSAARGRRTSDQRRRLERRCSSTRRTPTVQLIGGGDLYGAVVWRQGQGHGRRSCPLRPAAWQDGPTPRATRR